MKIMENVGFINTEVGETPTVNGNQQVEPSSCSACHCGCGELSRVEDGIRYRGDWTRIPEPIQEVPKHRGV